MTDFYVNGKLWKPPEEKSIAWLIRPLAEQLTAQDEEQARFLDAWSKAHPPKPSWWRRLLRKIHAR